MFGSMLNAHQAGMIVCTLVMLVLLYLFFSRTRLGLAMRAAAANPESARLVGIRVGWMIALGWGLASAIGAVAGMLIAPIIFLEPNMMLGVCSTASRGGPGRAHQPRGRPSAGSSSACREPGRTYVPVVGSELKLTIALS